MEEFQQYSLVKVVGLSKTPDEYNGFGINRRTPSVGDVGVVVEVLRKETGDIVYVVECMRPDGSSEWLSDFSHSELTVHET